MIPVEKPWNNDHGACFPPAPAHPLWECALCQCWVIRKVQSHHIELWGHKQFYSFIQRGIIRKEKVKVSSHIYIFAVHYWLYEKASNNVCSDVCLFLCIFPLLCKKTQQTNEYIYGTFQYLFTTVRSQTGAVFKKPWPVKTFESQISYLLSPTSSGYCTSSNLLNISQWFLNIYLLVLDFKLVKF